MGRSLAQQNVQTPKVYCNVRCSCMQGIASSLFASCYPNLHDKACKADRQLKCSTTNEWEAKRCHAHRYHTNQATLLCEPRQGSHCKAPTLAALQQLAGIEEFCVKHLDDTNWLISIAFTFLDKACTSCIKFVTNRLGSYRELATAQSCKPYQHSRLCVRSATWVCGSDQGSNVGPHKR